MRTPEQLVAEVFADGAWEPAAREESSARIRNTYGLDEDLGQFVELCAEVPAMREPLEALCGMRHSCPENLFEIAIIALVLQNATIARTMHMMRNLLCHYRALVDFAGATLRCFFTPHEIATVSEEEFRIKDRLIVEFQKIKGVGPYTAAVITSHTSLSPPQPQSRLPGREPSAQ